MKNNIILPEGVNSKPFLEAIESNLSANLNKYLIGALSNMLALDYANRAKNKTDLDQHINLCITRLSHHLRHRIVMEEDFSSVMTLFAIAITEKKMDDDAKTNSKEQEQDLLADGIIAAHFSDLSPEEQRKLKDVLRSMLSGSESKDIMNFISSDPKLFYSIVFVAYKEKTKANEIAESVRIHVNTITTQNKSINKSINNVKSIASKITLAVGLFAAASVGVIIGGLALPALLIPAAAASIRLAPAIGDRLGDSFSKNSGNIKEKQTNLKGMIASILQAGPSKSPALAQEKHVQQKRSMVLEKGLEIAAPLKGIKQLEHSKEKSKGKGRER